MTARKKSLILFIVLLIISLCVLWRFIAGREAGQDSPLVITDISKIGRPTFSSPEQQIAFRTFLTTHCDLMELQDTVFGQPFTDVRTDWAKSTQENWDLQRGAFDLQMGELFFGKEFFTMFMRYHQHSMDGILKFMTQDLDGAMASLGKAKADAKKLKRLPMKNREWVSHLFVDKMVLETDICLGVTECMRGKTKSGIAALGVACDKASKLNWHWGKIQAAYYSAVYAEHANAPNAMTLYQNTLEMAREKRNHDFIWKCSFRIATQLMNEGHLESAISLLEEALISIEFMRTKAEDDGRKVYFMNDKFPVYRMLMEALLNKGEGRKSLEVSENSKSRVLQDLLSTTYRFDMMDPEHYGLVVQEQVLLEYMESFEGTKGKDAEMLLAAMRKEHENVLKAIRQKNPDFGVLKVGVSADADQIQAHLDGKTVLLEYNMMPEYLIAWLVTKDAIRVEKIPITTETLTHNIQATRMMMNKPKLPAVYKLLGSLYESIIKPFEKEIQGKHLILVPDAALHYLPFAALMDAKGKFLVEHHTISVAPSFTVLKYCMAKKKREPKTILAFGNPDIQDAKMDLPNAQLEVKNIVEHFARSEPHSSLPDAGKISESEVYLRKEASETLAKKIMGNFDIIHFACHGEMVKSSSDLMQACLRLAPDEENDGKLTAEDVFDLKLSAQLVILSGCETGYGELCGGDEMMGLTRSFLYAGTPCVMVSHWKVDDSATCELMGNFYENMAKSGKAEALRAAQRKTMQTKKHPYYWAAFYLVGDGR